ncbi:PREDICTED: lysine histidine transporter-like 7, partial [Tarenaya hassleriana]|uniref:lysine histidine transporter-like 7 n=1 Tax=Tarenaya hassleriana TaxID=28532 RepID=UPI00053C4BD9
GLPITESRNGNVYTATFHLLCSGVSFQALLLPAAFAALGWAWGIISLSVGFIWQMYTAWLLVHLHESVPGTRFSRFLRLAITAFGEKIGKLVGIFPVMYLSGGACVILIITGGKSMQQLYGILSGDDDDSEPLTSVHWFLIFACIAVSFAQFPNLNSLFGLSLIGGVMAMGFCTMIWVLPVDARGRSRNGVSYDTTDTSFSSVFNAVGFIALAFRGHNLILEIQGTLPSNSKKPSSKTMWRAVMVSQVLIAMCMFPLSIATYWAYGNTIPTAGGTIGKYLKFYGQDYSKHASCFIHITFILSCLCSYPITAMPACDNLEFVYTTRRRKPCTLFARTMLRVLFGSVYLFVAVSLPFLPNLAVLIGAIPLSLTFTYPCFMWIAIKRPSKTSMMWYLNVLIGFSGVVLSILLVVTAAMRLADKGLRANFFKP